MKKIILYLIRFYQNNISPYKGTKCPYIPTCSAYGIEAVQTHGAIWGSVLTVWRILRCNPFSKGGYDPVPDEVRLIRVRDVYCKFRRKNH